MKKRTIFPILILALALSGCGGADATMEDAHVTLPDYTGIPVTAESPEVTDEEVAAKAEGVIGTFNQSNPLDRTVIEEGDTVSASIYLYDKDGNEFTDASLSSGFIHVGSGTTYPEIEAGLVGVTCGDTVTISFTLPDPYIYNESLSGTSASAEITPRYIKNPEGISLATLTDEQAEAVYPGCGGVTGFYDRVREELVSQNEGMIDNEAYQAVCSYLLENSKISPFPGAELKTRTEEYLEETAAQCEEYYDMTMDEYYEMLGTTKEGFREQVEGSLSDTISLELIFTAIAEKEGIGYTEEEYEAYIQELMDAWGLTSTDELYEQYTEGYLRTTLAIEKAADWVIDQADITYEEVPAEETVTEEAPAAKEAPAEEDAPAEE